MHPIDLPSLALILGALARGTTRIGGTAGLDRLAAALSALGARVTAITEGEWTVQGTGVGGWREPDRVLDLTGRDGAVPLLAGALASHPFSAVLSGDSEAWGLSLAGLRAPLERLGARFMLRRLDRLPGTIAGCEWPLPARHGDVEGAMALALLLAGLNSPGQTGVPAAPDLAAGIDLLRQFGASVEIVDGTAWINGHPDLVGTDVSFSA